MTSSVAFCEDAGETPEVAVVVVTLQGDSRCGKERKTKKQLVSNRTCIIHSFFYFNHQIYSKTCTLRPTVSSLMSFQNNVVENESFLVPNRKVRLHCAPASTLSQSCVLGWCSRLIWSWNPFFGANRLEYQQERHHWSVADPGFPRGGGANSPGGGANIRFRQISPKTAWNWKNFDPRGGGGVSVDAALRQR